MSDPRTAEQMSSWMREKSAQAERLKSTYAATRERVSAIRHTEVSRDGLVTVTFEGGTHVVSVVFSESALSLSASALSALTTQTIHRGVQQAARLLNEELRDITGRTIDLGFAAEGAPAGMAADMERDYLTRATKVVHDEEESGAPDRSGRRHTAPPSSARSAAHEANRVFHGDDE